MKIRPSQFTLITIGRIVGPALLVAICINAPNAAQVSNTKDRERGIELYQQSRFAEAVAALQQAVKVNKQDYEAWHFLGLGLIQQKDFKSATKCFETALKLEPRFAAGHAGLAYVLLLRNKQKEAVREATAALTIDPTIPDAHYIIGVVRLREGAKNEALENANAAIKFQGRFAPAYLLKSEALVAFVGEAIVTSQEESSEARKSRYQEAAAALEKYLELNPNAPNKALWTQQLESLRFVIASRPEGDPDKIFSGKDVTTKVRVLSKPEPTYTEEARHNQITGTIILRCVFAADGTVKHFIVVKGLPDGLTEICIRAAKAIKFIPATLNGRPVSMWMELQYNFGLY